MKINPPLESQEGKALKTWADHHPIAKKYLFHIPNGGYRNPIEARHLRDQGVKSGVSDYFLAFPANGYHGLWVELKRRGKAYRAPSMTQSEWIRDMEAMGFQAFVARGWEEAAEIIERYLVDVCRPKGLMAAKPVNSVGCVTQDQINEFRANLQNSSLRESPTAKIQNLGIVL